VSYGKKQIEPEKMKMVLQDVKW